MSGYTISDDNSRNTWTSEDVTRLLSLWSVFGSIMLIAAIMGRPPSSIQTQASRKQLPKRGSLPGLRRRWTKEEDKKILDIIQNVDENNKLDILKLASEMNRSIDAIINRLSQEHHIDIKSLVRYLVIPDPKDIAKSDVVCLPTKEVKPKRCPMCLELFIPTDSGNRVCPTCRSSDAWRMASYW